MTKFFRSPDDSPDDEDLEEEIKTMYPGFVCQVPDSPAPPQVPMHVVVPFLGRLRFVRDWNGVILLGFVTLGFMYSIFTTTFIIILPQYQDGNISGAFSIYYACLNVMCLLTLLNVSTMNPGEVTPEETDHYRDPAVSTYCKICHLHRPPRGYHCIKCGHCVRRMDYHYTWLNNCVGEENHYLLLLFLVYTFLLCLTTLTLAMLHLYKFPKCLSCDRGSFYIKHSIWMVYIQNILCVIIGLQTFVSIIVQHLNIIMDGINTKSTGLTKSSMDKLEQKTNSHLRYEVNKNRTILENIFLSPVYECVLSKPHLRSPSPLTYEAKQNLGFRPPLNYEAKYRNF